jgi:hypothetical protein
VDSGLRPENSALATYNAGYPDLPPIVVPSFKLGWDSSGEAHLDRMDHFLDKGGIIGVNISLHALSDD